MVKKRLQPPYYEIAVAGGGLAGLVAAAATADLLAAKGRRLALIERQPFTSQLKPAFDGRTTAIAWQGRQLLQAIGLWDRLLPHAAPIKTIRVADTFAAPGLTFDSAELAGEMDGGPFGHIIENRHLRSVLLTHLRALSNVDLYNPASVTALDTDGPLAQLALSSGETLHTTLVLAADGKASPLRAMAGIPTFDLSYDQQALVCVLEVAQPHGNIALEHFLPEGPFAVLPMQDIEGMHLVSIVWTVKPATAKALLHLDPMDVVTALASAGAAYLEPQRLATPLAAFPLGLRHAKRYTAPHFALIGEAAHAIHPIAGQGFNLGLRDIAYLRDSLQNAYALGLRADDASVLMAYERQRRGDNQRMVGATDLLDRLFSQSLPPLARLRQLGLAIVNSNRSLRRYFMRQAAGLGLQG